MMTRHAIRGLVLSVGMAVLPAVAAAQEPPPAGGPPAAQTELVFEREVFAYPSFQRRNPFKPLVAGDQGGPRFEQLRLMGIIHSDDPALSVAVLGTSTVTISQDATTVEVQGGEAWYLKVGQTIGNIRIVEIRREQVVVEVEEFGLTEQKIMQLQTRRVGGTP
ncbi:MAG TPA: hypothetical protein VJ997_09070 [Longimicrobiales bacterium]|nr:hypothetical protein [Longimicrobiales bacterium]